MLHLSLASCLISLSQALPPSNNNCLLGLGHGDSIHRASACYSVLKRKCGLPPKKRWTLHKHLFCGAGGGLLWHPATTLDACKKACLAYLDGDVLAQSSKHKTCCVYDQAHRRKCEGVVVNRSKFQCWLGGKLEIGNCSYPHHDFDTHALAEPAPETAVPQISRKHGAASPSEVFRELWQCHLIENGGTTGFEQLNRLISSVEDLNASGWYTYFDTVYGVKTLTFPFSLGELSYFHIKKLPEGALRSLKYVPIKRVVWEGTSEHILDPPSLMYGQIVHAHYPLYIGDIWRTYRHSNVACAVGSSACTGLQSILSRGFPSHTSVEVTHICCDPNGDGMWHNFAPGSGIWYDIGNTFVFKDHQPGHLDRIRELNCSVNRKTSSSQIKSTFECLRSKGYDTVQFTNYLEHTVVKYEIVALQDRHIQRDGCFDVRYAWKYARGWDAAQPCRCKPGAVKWHALNCDG